MALKSKITLASLPPHLYFILALPCKTHATTIIDATCLIC